MQKKNTEYKEEGTLNEWVNECPDKKLNFFHFFANKFYQIRGWLPKWGFALFPATAFPPPQRC